MCGLKCQIIRLESIDPVTAKMKPQHTIIPGSIFKEVCKINWHYPKWGVKKEKEGYMKSISIFAHFLHVNRMSLGLEDVSYCVFQSLIVSITWWKTIKKLNIMITLPSCFMLGLKSTLVTVSLWPLKCRSSVGSSLNRIKTPISQLFTYCKALSMK